MSGDKRWTVDDYGRIRRGGKVCGWVGSWSANREEKEKVIALFERHLELAGRDDRDAARLRSLAATFDSHLNRDKTYTGAQVAAMLRDGEG